MKCTTAVRIKDSAIVACATLSNRYISDRFLPDKAIDLIDERPQSCASRSILCPRRSISWNARSCNSKSKAGPASAKKISVPRTFTRDRAPHRRSQGKSLRGMKAKWQSERKQLRNAHRQGRAGTIADAAGSGRNAGDLARHRSFSTAAFPNSSVVLRKKATNWPTSERRRYAQEKSTKEDVAEVVAKWTGVPVSRCSKANAKTGSR